MTKVTFDRDSWERRWEQALGGHAEAIASRPPNAHLLAEIADLPPGRALDAGCGHGSEAIWLAASGWRINAVDVPPGVTLFMVGHRPVDPATGAPTPAAGQVQVSVDAVVDALDPREWEFLVAEDRLRAAAGTGVDAVVCAVRHT